MLKRKATTKHVLVLSGDGLRPEAVNQLRTSLGVTDQIQSGLILTEGVNYVGRYEIGNADDRKLSRRHVQFTVQPGVLYKHVTVCLLGTNPSVFQRIRDDGFKEKFFMEKDKTYTMAPGDVVWLLKDLYPLKLEEVIVTVQATTLTPVPSENNPGRHLTDAANNSPTHSNPETLSEFPQNKVQSQPNESQENETAVPRNSEDLFAQEMSAMIEELREQYLQSIQTKPHPSNQNANQFGSSPSTPRKTPSTQTPDRSSPEVTPEVTKRDIKSSRDNSGEKKWSRAEELEHLRKLYIATLQRAEEEHRRIEMLKDQLREASEKVMKLHIIAQAKRAGVSEENAKNISKKDYRKTIVLSQDSSTTIASDTQDLFLDFDNMVVSYESRRRGTPLSSPTPTFHTPLPSQQASTVTSPIPSNTPTRTNSYTQLPDVSKEPGTPTNRVTRSNSPLKNELTNDELNQILNRTRSNSQFVYPSSVKTSPSNLLSSASSKPLMAIPIFPGITLETQDVVEFQMSSDVRKQLAKLNQQPVSKQKSATAGRAPKQRATVIGRQSSESIGQNKTP
mmetsp:Transcript_14087/g.19605  ORF Transcript_14087/g.19605 Transcript_14087/m.19605 type:complete len:562 (-) Transcript_14087:10-1695(-)